MVATYAFGMVGLTAYGPLARKEMWIGLGIGVAGAVAFRMFAKVCYLTDEDCAMPDPALTASLVVVDHT